MHEAATDPKDRSRRPLWRRLRELSLPWTLLVVVVTPGTWDGCFGKWDEVPAAGDAIRQKPATEPFDYSIRTESPGNRTLVMKPKKNAAGYCLEPLFEVSSGTYPRKASIVAANGDNVGINCSVDDQHESKLKTDDQGNDVETACAKPTDTNGVEKKYPDRYSEVSTYATYAKDSYRGASSDSHCSPDLEAPIPGEARRLFYCEHKYRKGNVKTYPADCYEITGLGL